jgi:hypothetical protein
MKAEFFEKFFTEGGMMLSETPKTVELPFSRVSARAIVVRRGDGAILGTLHRQNGRYALPGRSLPCGWIARPAS